MKKVVLFIFVFFVIVVGVARGELIDYGNGVLYDDASDLYWFQDLSRFNNQGYGLQKDTISALNSEDSFKSSLWRDWHMASSDEVQSLWNNTGSSIVESFNSAYSVYYLGRYDKRYGNRSSHYEAGYMAYSDGTIFGGWAPGQRVSRDNYRAYGLSAWVAANPVVSIPDGGKRVSPSFDIPDFSGGLDKWGHLESFRGFDSGKKTVVIVHGWNREEGRKQLPDWVYDMAAALPDEVNVLAWNWQEVAYGLKPGTPQDYVAGEAISLSRELAKMLGEEYNPDIHLIGHSLGSGVVARTAIYLQDDFEIERLTLLDGPTEDIVDADVRLSQLIPQIKDETFIENYVSKFGAYYVDGSNVANYGLNGRFNDSSLGDHSWVHKWYTDTIVNSNSNSGYQMKREDVDFSTPYYQRGEDVFEIDIWDTYHRFSTEADPKSVLSQDDLDFYASGSVWEYDGVYTMLTNSPVYLMTEFLVPEYGFLSFDISMLELHEGDRFEVWIEDFLLLSVYADMFELDEWYTFADFDLSRWRDKLVRLTFALIAEMDGIHSSMGVRNVQIYSYNSSQAPVPEPGTMLLFGFGLLGLAGIVRRR